MAKTRMEEAMFEVRVCGRSGHEETISFDVGELALSDLSLLVSDKPSRALIEEAMARYGRDIDEGVLKRLDHIEVYLREQGLPVEVESAGIEAESAGAPDSAARRISRCRSLLQLANFVLPPAAREDALDEWMDEIQCAAEENLPLGGRVLSILCRSLPALALRARLPVRARRGEGS